MSSVEKLVCASTTRKRRDLGFGACLFVGMKRGIWLVWLACVIALAFPGCSGGNAASLEDGVSAHGSTSGSVGSSGAASSSGGARAADAAGDSPNGPPAADASAGGDASSQGGSNDAGTAGADAAVVDAASATRPDGAAADASTLSTDASVPPGDLACGASPCNASTEFCCVQPDGSAACVQNGNSCAGGASRTCARAADCQQQQVCCYDFSSTPASAECRGDCGGGGGLRVQACETSSECQSGTCAPHACTAGGSIQSCRPISPECP
jgi:hypothetical protein